MPKTLKTKRQQVEATLPCCDNTVKVTGRPSKQRMRGRYHSCTSCGRKYMVEVSNGKVNNIRNVG